MTSPRTRPGNREELAVREVDDWAHHVVDLYGDGPVHTRVLDRPVGLAERLETIGAVLGGLVTFPVVERVAERILTPRRPYQDTPLSYLRTGGNSWILSGETDVLAWDSRPVPRRDGSVEVFFSNAVQCRFAVITLNLHVESEPGVNGTYDVLSVHSPPVVPETHTVFGTGGQDHTVDVVVRPINGATIIPVGDPVLVLVVARAGLKSLVFRKAAYLAIP